MTQKFKKHQALPLRLWHWLDAAAIFGLLSTVLLRKTFLSWRTNAELIQSKAAEAGATGLTSDVAAAIARGLRDPMWQWHYVLGFALAALILFRLVLGFVDAEQAPLRSLLRDISRKPPLHDLVVKGGYALFYGVVALMSVTGVAMYFKAELGLSKSLVTGLKGAHELALWFFVLFVAAHLVGVVVAELRGQRGIVSDMINGGDRSA